MPAALIAVRHRKHRTTARGEGRGQRIATRYFSAARSVSGSPSTVSSSVTVLAMIATSSVGKAEVA
jgi:hypothetical protein